MDQLHIFPKAFGLCRLGEFRMKKTILAGASVLALGLTTPAFAQDNGIAIAQSGDDNEATSIQNREDNVSGILLVMTEWLPS